MKKFHLKGEKEGERTRCRQTNYGGKKVATPRIKALDEFLTLPVELQCKKCLEAHKIAR
jgi:hypothetical protein